ncbi:MAG: hypothetical protein H0W83_15380, partial [Planctomycetes bacterium]|nr:hypothetical protein [Planctomycetota bacterium]
MRNLSVLLLASCISLAMSTAISAEAMSPGSHKSLKAGSGTWDCYVPKSYADKADEFFPVLYISNPSGDPGFRGLEAWSERRGVILVTINDSKNGPTEPNIVAQDAVLGESDKLLRVHPCLRYATGQSGAGAASMKMITRYPDRFAGAMIQVHSAGPPPKHVAVVYVGGRTDDTHPWAAVKTAYETAKGMGCPARFIDDPGTHDTAVHIGEAQAALLDWLLLSTCAAHPKLDKAGLASGLARLQAELAAIRESPAADQPQRCETLLDIPVVANDKKLGLELRQVWMDGVMAAADAAGDKNREHEVLMHAADHPAFASCGPKATKALNERLKALRSEEP